MDIYRRVNGQTILIFSTPINKDCERKWELQGDDYITLKFNVSGPMAFKIGDYTDTKEDEGGENGRWYITSAVKPTYNKSNGAYTYEIKFEAEYKLWNNYVDKYITATAETNWKLTAQIRTHLKQILRNLDALGLRTCWNGKQYTYSVDDEVYDSQNNVISGVVSNEPKCVEYSNTKICDALDAIANAWECEWWVEGEVIHFGYCEGTNEPTQLELGVNVESWDIEESSGVHANRIYVFGSTKNIPSNYRRSLLISTANRVRTDAGYYRITDNNVALSLKQIVQAYPTDRSVSMIKYADSAVESVAPEKGYDSAYTKSTIFHRQSESDYYFEGMPHKLIFGTGSVFKKVNLTLVADVVSVVDDQYTGQDSLGFDGDEVVFNTLVKVYKVASITEKVFEVASKVTRNTNGVGANITVQIPLADNPSVFDYSTEVGFDMDVQVKNLYGSEIKVTGLSMSDLSVETLLAQPFNVYLVDSNLVTKYKDVLIYCSYQGLSVPAEDATQDEKLAYAFDQQQKGIYYSFRPPENYRFLVPNSSIQGDVPMSWYTDNFQSDSLYALAERRLMLPNGQAYIEQKGLKDLEIVEDVVTLDDVYPRMNDMTIGELIWHEEDGVLTKYEDGTEKLEKYKAYYIRDSIFTSTGVQSMKNEYVLAGQTARVRFGSGRLNGMEFDLELETGYTDSAGTTFSDYHKIIRNEDYGAKLPNSYLYPQVGDKIIYIGWDEAQMGSTGFVEAAEQELLAKGKEYLDKARINDRTYNITLMELSRYKLLNLLEKETKNLKESEDKQLQVISDNGQTIGFCESMIVKGKKVKICDKSATIYDPSVEAEVSYRISRVIGFTRPLDILYDHPTIKVGVSGVYSRLADIENKLRKNKNG